MCKLTIERLRTVVMDNPKLFVGLNPNHREAFFRWIPKNVHVVSEFGKYARYLKDNGNRTYYSAYAIRERLRWDSMVSEVGTEYKISNNITPFVARLIMAIDPKLEGMFVTKSSS